MLLFVSWLTLSVYLIQCGNTVYGTDVQECFVYRVDNGKPSPAFNLRYRQNTLMRIFDYFDDSSRIRILDGDSCLLLLREDGARNESQNCQRTVHSVRGYFRFELEQRGQKVLVQREAGGRFESLYEGAFGSLNTIRVESDSKNAIAVVFGCPSECYEFEDAIIYKDFNSQEPLSFYGRKLQEDGEIDAVVKFTTNVTIPLYNHLTASWPDMNQLLKHDCLYNINLTATYGSHPQFSSIIEVYGSFQSVSGEPRYLAYAITNDITYLLLDFVQSKGIRWSFCKPRDTAGSLPQCSNTEGNSSIKPKDCVNMLYFYVSLAIWGIFFLLILAVTVTTYRLHLSQRKQENTGVDHVYDDVATPTRNEMRRPQIIPRHNPAFVSSEDEPIYEDPEAFIIRGREALYIQPV